MKKPFSSLKAKQSKVLDSGDLASRPKPKATKKKAKPSSKTPITPSSPSSSSFSPFQ